MTDATPMMVKVKRILPATPERVFAAWTDPDSFKQWFVPASVKAKAVEIDARPGGHLRIMARNDEDGDFEINGIYREVLPPTRLVFTWRSSQLRRFDSLVTVDFRAIGNQTELTITDEWLPDAEVVRRRQQGWEKILAAMADVLVHSGEATAVQVTQIR